MVFCTYAHLLEKILKRKLIFLSMLDWKNDSTDSQISLYDKYRPKQSFLSKDKNHENRASLFRLKDIPHDLKQLCNICNDANYPYS